VSAPLNLDIRGTETGVLIPVRLTPKSSRDEISGVEYFGGEAALKARVRALPEGGMANAALEKLIAKWLGVASSCVKVAQGSKSRMKQVAVDGDAIALSALIASKLAELRVVH
jgi:uncharacterized protein (TIGR00251 family)